MQVKKQLLLYIFLLSTIISHAQEVEGSIRYLIVHDWAKKMAAVDYLSKQRKERVAYMWGNQSEWKEYANLYFNPTQSKYEDSDERADANDEGYAWRKEAYIIQRDFATNTMHDVIQILGKTYLVEDSLHTANWKIMNDMKEVAGHVCMNAFLEDTIKKQKILVWFALDIPVPSGPERFGGLPGLILEADVNDGGMLITADKIELKKLTTELAPPKKVKAKKISESDYEVIVRKHMVEKRKAEEPPFWGIRY